MQTVQVSAAGNHACVRVRERERAQVQRESAQERERRLLPVIPFEVLICLTLKPNMKDPDDELS